MFWPPRFSQTSWIAYVGILLIALGVGRYGGRVFRWIGLGLLAVCGVAVSALLTLPSMSMSGIWGTINGKPWSSSDVISGFGIYSVVWAGLVVGAWFIGRRIRRALTSDRPNSSEAVVPVAVGTLSPREHEIFLLAARGLSNAEIATAAHIGESTVKTHLASISAKLGLTSRAALVVFAYEAGAVRAPDMANEELTV
jgi:DNA-binding CsgD family transcriptional regulator